ncbi:MAG: CDP-diacylglycerol--serine O-phosphatidyltransferase [Deltaproteobacteria bacterium]|nr:CDP-diacylglycerol--serine O-phosphatidyltransferase [Deltaproteobacteria bacterium]
MWFQEKKPGQQTSPRFLRRARRIGASKTQGTRRGFYLFPNLITSGSLLLGFYAITKSFQGDFLKASWAIFAATFFDGLDGKIARLTNSASPFGAQYDSLSDLVTFGVAPGLIMYNFALAQSLSARLGWTVAFLYVVCGALRLARYNIRPTSSKRFFEGFPIPAAANVMIFSVIFSVHMGLVRDDRTVSSIPNLILILTFVVAGLMVSTFPYYGFKDVDMFRRHKFGTLVFFVGLLVFTFQEPETMLFLLIMAYAISGPIVWYVTRQSGTPEQPTHETGDGATS